MEQAGQLRRNQTAAERRLGEALANLPVSFSPQVRFGNYVIDFYCEKFGLAVEVDGPSHSSRQSADRRRDNNLRSQGIQVVRFTNAEVFDCLEDVVLTIKMCLVVLAKDQTRSNRHLRRTTSNPNG